ncbi:MAG: hypothetical protein IJZ95_05305 [Oscillospiraceae bacterium]|nr:hypothetical protein [Oscillospiraceae bacterium]
MKAVTDRSRSFINIGAILLFVAIVVWFIIAVNNTQAASDEQELAAVKRSVENGITLCYSIEGVYPEDLGYLTEVYGVDYDSERFIIHYDCFAANIRPTVTVMEKGQ